jgi:hypothetical protein
MKSTAIEPPDNDVDTKNNEYTSLLRHDSTLLRLRVVEKQTIIIIMKTLKSQVPDVLHSAFAAAANDVIEVDAVH